jgi:LTXXQ motif family protein
MGIRLKLVSAPLGALIFSSTVAVAPAAEQSAQRGSASVAPTILGPAMLRPGMGELSCGTGAAGLGPWGEDRIEQTLSLNENQRVKFNGLKTASQRAIQYLNESCPHNDPVTPTGRMESMEQRLSALLEAVRTVQPALDDFYAALSDEQKARLNALEPSKSRTAEPARTASAPSTRASTAESPRTAEPPRAAAEPDNENNEGRTYVDRHGRVHQRHAHHGGGHRRFAFRLPIPIPF